MLALGARTKSAKIKPRRLRRESYDLVLRSPSMSTPVGHISIGALSIISTCEQF